MQCSSSYDEVDHWIDDQAEQRSTNEPDTHFARIPWVMERHRSKEALASDGFSSCSASRYATLMKHMVATWCTSAGADMNPNDIWLAVRSEGPRYAARAQSRYGRTYVWAMWSGMWNGMSTDARYN